MKCHSLIVEQSQVTLLLPDLGFESCADDLLAT